MYQRSELYTSWNDFIECVPDIRNIPPIMEEEVANFCRPPGPYEDLSELYERVPEPFTIEPSHTDEEFFKFQNSAKSKSRSLSLPPIRGNFKLLNRMLNCSPLDKKRFEINFKSLITDSQPLLGG